MGIPKCQKTATGNHYWRDDNTVSLKKSFDEPQYDKKGKLMIAEDNCTVIKKKWRKWDAPVCTICGFVNDRI